MTNPITKAHLTRRSAGKAADRKARTDKPYIAALHDLPCPCCGRYGVHVHHITAGRHTVGVPVDGGKRSFARDDRCAIPLCSETHAFGHDVIGSVEEHLSGDFGIDDIALAVALREAWLAGEPLEDVVARFMMGRAA